MFIPAWIVISAGFLTFVGAVFAAYLLRLERNEAAVFRAVAEGASDGLVLMQKNSQILWANQAYCENMGYSLDELIGRYPLEFALPPDIAVSREEARSFEFDPDETRFETLTRVRNIRKDGTEFVHEFSHAVIEGPTRQKYMLVGRDVSEHVARENALVEAREELRREAQSDALTGLSNRLHFRYELDNLLETGKPFAVFQFDMNRFKAVNDTYGHHAGDAVLRAFANHLTAGAGEDWITARTGGDEFTALAPGITDLSTAMGHAHDLHDAVQTPLSWGAGSIVCGASIGVAIWQGPEQSADDLVNCADVAAYEAKGREGKTVAGFDDEVRARYSKQQKFSAEVAKAIQNGDLFFHYQPVVDVPSDRLVKFELLVRWQHKEDGLLRPAEFLPLLEQLGLIEELDQLVIDQAIETLVRLDAEGLSHVAVSLNLSSLAVSRMSSIEYLIWKADSRNCDPARIIVELLETTDLTLTGQDTTLQSLERLRQAGFPIYLDDFGMGYAGLAHLASLDVQGLKIDRKLTSTLDSDPDARSIFEAIVALSGRLGIDVIAEGVETPDQMRLSVDAGCPVMQGHLIAHAMPLEDALRIARQDGWRRRAAS